MFCDDSSKYYGTNRKGKVENAKKEGGKEKSSITREKVTRGDGGRQDKTDLRETSVTFFASLAKKSSTP